MYILVIFWFDSTVFSYLYCCYFIFLLCAKFVSTYQCLWIILVLIKYVRLACYPISLTTPIHTTSLLTPANNNKEHLHFRLNNQHYTLTTYVCFVSVAFWHSLAPLQKIGSEGLWSPVRTVDQRGNPKGYFGSDFSTLSIMLQMLSNFTGGNIFISITYSCKKRR